ncbi:4-(cytidine 5'-diphospho)-2-C-methyl-D-erythritol kinase [Candidatus Synechococcus spongiarum]|uniref:4-(cytidine 5'-diphospho)-2-C-methyl-D-erythritol kinase n=1 Tax=Candidatus Synechococcus spongiarum TaxID=431041 RepID=UPI000471B290|nr:4-(cytidine 5'-diphospho)-2-C-methyl-D-erythritol kinase [Candidatus Synechococcus spongiarum]
MTCLKLESPAKVNLHLALLGLRDDGFHELAIVMQAIDFCDELTLEPHSGLQLHCEGLDVASDHTNLVMQAARLLQEAFPEKALGARMHLRKRIPLKAGLGGGSSNAAATLMGLNRLWGLGLSAEELQVYGGRLGSDVAFFIAGGTQLCFGRGERLEPVARPRGGAVLLNKRTDVSVTTGWAYGICREELSRSYLKGEQAFCSARQALRRGEMVAALTRGDLVTTGHLLLNQMEEVVAAQLPAVRQNLELLRQTPDCCGVSMSGSGPSVFALFSTMEAARAAQQTLAGRLKANEIQSWICGLREDGARFC